MVSGSGVTGFAPQIGVISSATADSGSISGLLSWGPGTSLRPLRYLAAGFPLRVGFPPPQEKKTPNERLALDEGAVEAILAVLIF